jgi:hypothetical protein
MVVQQGNKGGGHHTNSNRIQWVVREKGIFKSKRDIKVGGSDMTNLLQHTR